jgi:hypothetical protein
VTLDEFDALLRRFWQSESVKIRILSLAPVHALAREMQVLDILPCTFYFLSTLSVEEIFKQPCLSFEEMKICLIGRARLIQKQSAHSVSSAFDFEASPRCLLEGACQRQQPSPLVWKLHTTGAFHTVMALTLPVSKEKLERIFQICSECAIDSETRILNGRRHIWNELPAIFNLGSWEEMLKARNEVV